MAYDRSLLWYLKFLHSVRRLFTLDYRSLLWYLTKHATSSSCSCRPCCILRSCAIMSYYGGAIIIRKGFGANYILFIRNPQNSTGNTVPCPSPEVDKTESILVVPGRQTCASFPLFSIRKNFGASMSCPEGANVAKSPSMAKKSGSKKQKPLICTLTTQNSLQDAPPECHRSLAVASPK